MTSKAIICAIAAASFSFASLSFADDDEGRGESSRAEQRGPMGRDGHDSGHRNFDRRDQQGNRHDNGNRGGYARHDAHNDRNYYGGKGPQYHRGGRIPTEYRNRQYVVNNWRDHRLDAPPRGQQWVQVGSDYVLIAIATGIIAQLMLGQ
jgi:Ni/Co efflux regulator RcnB